MTPTHTTRPTPAGDGELGDTIIAVDHVTKNFTTPDGQPLVAEPELGVEALGHRPRASALE